MHVLQDIGNYTLQKLEIEYHSEDVIPILNYKDISSYGITSEQDTDS
ncbi:hypothetical protein O998_04555 [Anaplasma phagocytophilum str. Norway variant1]|uniref:Uncharacterized protein n=2 Tax=Anaplasma phagocytophilum TaxID=948 RepID=A0A7H9DZR5_ANAPH|nr:hypothetical protein [Anaplasma phagocytophilum]KJV63571.1 hypothetical protein APHMUC_0845 [Anaplasma phagocytophilum str. ApMUC09]QLL67000.1 hypothetical protein O998_04555 [Anaplasma phagocytophilum str. Norway variant1]